MNGTRIRMLVIVLVVAVLAAAGGYLLGPRRAPLGQSPGAADARAVLYWYDPMRPEQHFDRPGKSPFMDMQLLPRYAEAAADDRQPAAVRIDPVIAQNLGVRYALVERAPWVESLDAVGSIVYDQRRVVVIQARSGGFVTNVHARAPGDLLPRGAPLVDLLVPDWAGAQAEFMALLAGGDRALVDAARLRLALLGMPQELIAHVEATRVLQPTFTVVAPIAGTIETLDAREGMAVSAGATLVKITGIGTVWLEAEVPEAQAALAVAGKRVDATLTAYPGRTLSGRIIAVLPEANAETRTLRVRIELPNPDGRLKPGMFARVHLQPGRPQTVLQVASEAVIRSGTRNLVLIAADGGRYTPAEVRLGPEANGRSVILGGLSEGERVVVSGQFLIDSEASLKGVLTRLPADAAPLHEASGRIESVSPLQIMVAHGAIAALGWPAMTMAFRPGNPAQVAGLRPGDTVTFRFRQKGDDYVIEQLQQTGGGQ
jgi:Cu(I)/Ag(I) efflux system membrane fusion protein